MKHLVALKIFLNRHTRLILFLTIFSLALLLRFINYDNRLTLGQDQARDAIISSVFLQEKTLPLIGPPSSAGPFSFGPYYYWLIINSLAFLPNYIFAPWITFTLFSVGVVALFFFIGEKLAGTKLAIIAGLTAATSSAAIFHSADMLNPILVPFFTTLAFFSLVNLVESRRLYFSLLLGLSVGLAINFHFQAFGLLTIFPLVLLINSFSKKQKLLVFCGLVGGLMITFLPLVYFNFQNNNALLNNFINYFAFGQTQFKNNYLFLKDPLLMWPRLWGETLTFIPISGYFFITVTALVIIFAWRKNRRIFPQSLLIIIVSLLLQVILLFFYKGARLPVYLLVFHPYIILLTAWSFWWILIKNRKAGLVLIISSLAVSLYSNLNIIKGFTQKPLIFSVKEEIDTKIGGQIDLLSYNDSGMIYLPLYYLYTKEQVLFTSGHKIGVCEAKLNQTCPTTITPFLVRNNYSIYDLNELSLSQLNNSGFLRLSGEQIKNHLYDYYNKTK